MKTKTALLLAILVCGFFACKKNNDNSNNNPNDNNIRSLNDSVRIVTGPYNYSIDVDNDATLDVKFYGDYVQRQTQSSDKLSIIPLRSGMEISLKDSVFNVGKESFICPISTDTLIFDNIMMCGPNDPRKYDSVPLTFAYVGDTVANNNFSNFNNELLVYSSIYGRSYGLPCGLSTYTNKLFGNGISSMQYSYIYIRINNKNYAIKMIEKLPNLIFESVITY